VLAKICSAAVIGLDAEPVDVEVDIGSGLVKLLLVGLPDAAVRESSERVQSAIRNSGYRFPFDKRITVNLAPADLRKEGPAYDLPIAVGVLAASGQVSAEAVAGSLILGELSLDGTVRHIRGALSVADMARHQGVDALYVPAADALEAALIPGLKVYPVASLGALMAHLQGFAPLTPIDPSVDLVRPAVPLITTDFAEVQGQEHAKRAFEVASGGGHNLLLVGPPGAGKTLMARAVPGILPALTLEESLEVTRIYSVADMLPPDTPLIQVRPFRAPHHTISNAGLVGGGQWPRPGEISLAHRGVLFLDEMPEFNSRVLEVMRQPMEDKTVTISRAQGALTFPANFMLVKVSQSTPQRRSLPTA
jgi:magnesium chelatase family protein